MATKDSRENIERRNGEGKKGDFSYFSAVTKQHLLAHQLKIYFKNEFQKVNSTNKEKKEQPCRSVPLELLPLHENVLDRVKQLKQKIKLFVYSPSSQIMTAGDLPKNRKSNNQIY